MSPTRAVMRLDAKQEAAKLAAVFERAVRQILESNPERYASITGDLNLWVESALAGDSDTMLSIRKRAILAEREALLEASFAGSLDAAGQQRLSAIEAELEQIERVEADAFGQSHASSRAGRIEDALDRLEIMLNSAR